MNISMNPNSELEQSIVSVPDIVQVPDILISQARQFQQVMMMYTCAIREVKTKLEVLNDELSVRNQRNPIEMIKSRVKKPMSIVEKLQRKGLPISLEAMVDNLDDVAGIRVICSFVDDIYDVADMLIRQDDIKVIAVKDYIKHPKENGYRSYHMILKMPVRFLGNTSETAALPCLEVQIRTIAMDCWASIEHELKYKHDIANPELMQQELKHCSDQIASTDLSLSTLKELILTPNADPDANSNTSAGAEKPVASDCRGIPLG